MVYEIIHENGLCEYYDIEKNPGITQKIPVREGKFAFLDNPEIAARLVSFSEKNQHHITFYMPQMHCSGCIWLLEQLPRLNKGIIRSRTNFLKKETSIVFNSDRISLRQLAELLTRIGYEPHISLRDLNGKKVSKHDRTRVYKIGIAGFCFGNIMLLSFPEYLASVDLPDEKLKQLFSYLNLGLAFPVFFYCASEFFISAWKALRQRFLNIDAPIALAVLITFSRSAFEILAGTGAGYLDSMSGIVFFMLVGRFFQDRNFQSLTFDRDYTSYFPIGVTVITENGEKQVPVSDLKKGNRIRIHSQEIIPADCILFMGKASIDYSFVTGETLPVEKVIGEIVYAGGRQTAASIELEVIREVSQSYLTQLWNNDVFQKKKEDPKVSFVHKLARHFTWVLFAIAISSAIYWQFYDPDRIWNAVTSILIVACPCALLLSATFTNGNMLVHLQKKGFFVKSAATLESIHSADTIVFDKTGTLSLQSEARVSYTGRPMTPSEARLLRSLAAQSFHPMSKVLLSQLPASRLLPVNQYRELRGQGSEAKINNVTVRIGSEEFITGHKTAHDLPGSRVYFSIHGETLGHYLIHTSYRPQLDKVVKRLRSKYKLAVLSGDNDSEKKLLRQFFGNDADLRFNQSPLDKLQYIQTLQDQGRKVIMIGDGLNDAGALQQSDAGIAITDDVNNFSPGCDAIMEGQRFPTLPAILQYCSRQRSIIYGSFIISLLYNCIGLFFAVQGALSPLLAAILMPASSISIILYTTGLGSLFARQINGAPNT